MIVLLHIVLEAVKSKRATSQEDSSTTVVMNVAVVDSWLYCAVQAPTGSCMMVVLLHIVLEALVLHYMKV
jgi:hypothetical protein